MKKVHRLLGTAKFIHGVHLALVGAIVVIVPLTSAHTVQVIHAHHTSAPKHQTVAPVQHIVVAPKPKPTPQPPAPATPTPPANPVATAPSHPAVTPAAAPAAVAATAAAPGKSVGSLSSAPSSTSSTTSSSSPTTSSTAPTTQPTSTSLPASSSYTSSNWAGYMSTSAVYTSVSGNWVVPSPTGNGTDTTADAAWIGIGGVSTQDLIQVGTEDTVDASGNVSSAIFYELLPDAPVYPASVIITAGDVIHATISELSAGQWSISITDQTSGKTFSTTVAYTSSHSSAEWIEEDPSYDTGQLVPFDLFGAINFSQGTTTANGVSQSIAASGASDITLVDQSGQPLADPSSLNGTGTAFTVTRR